VKGRSSFWDATIGQSHQISVRVQAMFNRSTIALGLRVSGGQITLDRTASSLGRLTATFAEPTLIPTQTGGTLTPFGYELAVQLGIIYGDGSAENLPMGIYPIQQTQIDGINLTSSVTAVDRSQLVRDARFEDDYSVAAGTNMGTAILNMVQAGVPGLPYSFTSTPYTSPVLTFAAQSDRWDAAQGMASSIGCELFFDGAGYLRLRNELSSATPVATIADGPGGVMVSAALSLDRSGAYNRVIATGENTTNAAVYRGVWTDDNPASPTYYFGSFGHKPRFYASPFIASDAQAASAAFAIGLQQTGVARSLDFGMVRNPALEPGDVVQIRRAALGLDEVHRIDSLTIDLGTGAMTGKSRLLQS
jgi:hypothetical protein